jgi:DNA-binding GntR family transcriptional regulator
VHRRLRGLILDGELAPGRSCPQVELAARLGVSRTPLREALRLLQADGLLDVEPSGRCTVPALTAADLEELTAIRIALEVQAVRRAVGAVDPDELAARLSTVMTAEALGDRDRWRRAHDAFHRTLTGPAGTRANAILAQLSDQAERYRLVLDLPFGSRHAADGHHALVVAARERDADRAAAILADHLAAFARAVMARLEHRYVPAQLNAVVEAGTRRAE